MLYPLRSPFPAPPNAAVAYPDVQVMGGTCTLLYEFTGILNPSDIGTVVFKVKVKVD